MLVYRKPSGLRSNDHSVTEKETLFGLCLEIQILTKKLSLNYINNTHSERHQLMMDLDSRGWSSKQISTLLNQHQILKPRTQTPYTQKDVWMSLMKLKKRENRKTDTVVSVGDWELWTLK